MGVEDIRCAVTRGAYGLKTEEGSEKYGVEDGGNVTRKDAHPG